MPLHLYRHAFSNLNRNIWILSLAMFINRSGSMVIELSGKPQDIESGILFLREADIEVEEM